MEHNAKLVQLEQHGRRGSLRISGNPKSVENDNIGAAVLNFCVDIKVDPRFNHKTLPYRVKLVRLPRESLDSFLLNAPPVTSERKFLKPRKTLRLNRKITHL